MKTAKKQRNTELFQLLNSPIEHLKKAKLHLRKGVFVKQASVCIDKALEELELLAKIEIPHNQPEPKEVIEQMEKEIAELRKDTINCPGMNVPVIRPSSIERIKYLKKQIMYLKRLPEA